MNILLLYPEYPNTFWSFKYALKFVMKKAPFPPLGLLTVASMLPKDWQVKLIDMNVEKLKDKDLLWADFVFISAMSVQKKSADEVIKKCKEFKIKIVAGGPLFTSSPELFPDVDHFILNEAEITLPQFLKDLDEQNLQRFYTTNNWADISQTPLPRWDLVKLQKYSSMNIQYSRGCPYDCDFCNITVLYGRKPRTKTKDQVISELQNLFDSGWRGPVFFVDDNFIGNKRKLKDEILPAIKNWMNEKQFPFWFNTEASINLADDDKLIQQMVDAGFNQAFIGIESPADESLEECNKTQNRNRNLIESINKIQNAGIDVQGGFIVGFDNDPKTIFDDLADFIQQSGIVTAMVGLLNAPIGTKLHKKLQNENRLLKDFTGDNTDFSINFIPKLEHEKLLSGYKKTLKRIYSPEEFYTRVIQFLKVFNQNKKSPSKIQIRNLIALVKSIFILGIFDKGKFYFWKLFFWSLINKPSTFSQAILYSIYGFHFRKVYANEK